MKAEAITLEDFLIQKNTRFIIPVYQRNYDWRQENCKKLIQDLIEISNKARKHFIGTIVDISSQDMISRKDYMVIDGQQRITTSILLLKAIYDWTDNDELREEILEDFLINKREDDAHKLKLKPIKRDNDVFMKLIKGDFENLDSSSNVYKNYLFFKNFFDSQDNELTPEDFYKAFQKLWIVHIALASGEDDPQLIFESINSTGVSLSSADLMRNYILMDKTESEQERLFTNYWANIEVNLINGEVISNFFYHYLLMKTNKTITQKNLYEIFKDYAYEQDVETLLKDILSFSKIYRKLILHTQEDTKAINESLTNLRELKMTVTYPFIMEVFNMHRQDLINEKAFVSVLDTIQSYIVRRIITDKGTKSLNKIFASLQKEITNTKGYGHDRYLDFFNFVIANKKGTASFPTDNEFKNDFMYKNIYGLKVNKYILSKLENYNNKEKIVIDGNISIEHIMPQTLSDDWRQELGDDWRNIHETYLDTIGNLTLTGYNSELSNNTFKTRKQEILGESKLSLNRTLGDIITWTEEGIKNRAIKIINDLALSIWKYPEISEDIQNSFEETYSIDDNISVTGKNPIKVSFFQDEEVSSWKDLLVAFLNQLQNNEPEKFELLLSDDIDDSIKKIIASSEQTFTKSFEISPSVFIETNLSANSIIKNIKTIYSFFNLEDIDLTYSISIK